MASSSEDAQNVKKRFPRVVDEAIIINGDHIRDIVDKYPCVRRYNPVVPPEENRACTPPNGKVLPKRIVHARRLMVRWRCT